MFAPHTAKTYIKRCEPRGIGNLGSAQEAVALRNRRIAEKVVTGSLLKSKPKSESKSLKRILREWETDERLKKLKPFVEYWNKWAQYYRDFDNNWWPKNRSQISCMERIIEVADEKGVHLDTFLGCTWKATEKRRHAPTVQLCLSNGIEFYDRFIGDLEFDLDQDEYEEQWHG